MKHLLVQLMFAAAALIVSFPVGAQPAEVPIVHLQPRIDSLEARLPQTDGLDRLDVLIPLVGFYADHDTEHALRLAWVGLALLDAHPDPLREARLRAGKALTHYVRSAYDSLRVETQRMLALAEATGDQRTRADALTLQANAGKAEGNYEAARTEAAEALRLYEHLKDRRGQAEVLWTQAGILRRQGQPYRATAERALALSETLGDGRLIVLTLLELGLASKDAGEWDAYRAESERALAVSETVPYQRGIVLALENLSDVHQVQGRSQEAVDALARALPLAEALGDRRVTARLISHQGLRHHVQGELAEAEAAYAHAVAMFEALGVAFQAAYYRANLGMVQFQLGRPAEGLGNLAASADQLEAMGSTEQYYPLAVMGYLYEERGNYAEAIAVLERARATTDLPTNQVNLLPILARSYLALGRVDAAAEAAEALLAFAEKTNSDTEMGNALALIARVEEGRGDAAAALAANTRAVALYRKMGRDMDLAPFYLTQTRLYERLARPDSALAAAEEALAVAEDTDQPLHRRDSYEALARLYEAQGDLAAALAAHKHFKAAHDSLFTVENESVVAELQTQYQTREQRQRIELLQREAEVRRLWLGGLIGGALLVLVIAGLVYNRYRLKTRAHSALTAAHQRVRAHETQLEDQTAKLEVQAVKLKELDEMKSRFFANISHELRTPLTLIRGQVEDVRAGRFGPVPHNARRPLDASLSQTHRLQRLVEELLDLSRLQSSRMHLAARPQDLDAFLGRLVGLFDSLAEKAGVALSYAGTGAPVEVYLDEDKLEKVITNLIGNALKFTDAGGAVAVTLEGPPAEDESGAGTFVTIRVSDNGAGIPADALPKIFERFYQVDASTTRRFGGMGVGLALARELVELHGGTIAVESTEGEGTTFTVTLPLGADHLAEDELLVDAPGTRVFPSPPAPLTSPGGNGFDDDLQPGTPQSATIPPPARVSTVLVVEDNVELRAYLRGHLCPRYRIIEAEDGAAGLERARSEPPDLIISDVMMPRMDGFTLLRKLKADDALKTVPVILLTARASVDDRLRGLQGQADAYLPKPFSMVELETRIHNLITLRRTLRRTLGPEQVTVEARALDLPEAEASFLEQVHTEAEAHVADGHFDVQALADALCVSKRVLERRMKELTGHSPAAYMRLVRLDRARQLIEGGVATTVGAAAHAVGFTNQGYFARLYQQTFGQSPAELVRRED